MISCSLVIHVTRFDVHVAFYVTNLMFPLVTLLTQDGSVDLDVIPYRFFAGEHAEEGTLCWNRKVFNVSMNIRYESHIGRIRDLETLAVPLTTALSAYQDVC